jgi:Zn-dependent peptidase ImmA (M78 family)
MTDSPGQRKIIVNSGLSFEQQRFWLAHELGHWVLGRLSTQASDPQCPPSPTGNQVERLCNAFAASLLMPEEWVRRVCEELHHPDRYDKTRTIAGRFLVSEAMMRIRLSELGLAAQRRWARAVERW